MKSAIVIALVACAVGCPEIKRVPSHENTLFIKADAQSLTKAIVSDLLKAPTTARFSLEARVGPNKNFVMVMGSVASENSFGASISVPIQATYYNDKGSLKTALLILDRKVLISDEELNAKCK